MTTEVRYLSIKEVAADPRYPFTESQLRHLLRNRERNGLEYAVRRISNKMYFATDKLEQWMEAQRA